MRKTLVLAAMCCLIPLKSVMANDPRPSIVFIYDASGSMWGQIDGSTKMEIAVSVLSEAVDGLPAQQQMALVAYGHRVEGDCRDVEFLVDMDNNSPLPVKAALNSIKPLGKTPLAYSASLVMTRLREKQIPATIILLTDGIESCDGDICSTVEQAKAEGLEFRMHIIGFGLQEDQTERLRCAAKAGGGRYFDASNAEALSEVINDAVTNSVDKPAGNFSVYSHKNGRPVDAFVEVQEPGQGTSVAAARTYGDTVLLYVPPGLYEMKVRPLEGTDLAATVLSGIESRRDRVVHRDVSFSSGILQLTTQNNAEGWDAVVKIRASGSAKISAGGRTYGETKTFEMDPGTYDVELQAMHIQGAKATHNIDGVVVVADSTHQLVHNFVSGELLVGVQSGGALVDATVNIADPVSGSSVAAGRTYTSASSNPKKFVLSPGKYTVTLTALGEYKGAKKTISVEVKGAGKVQKIIEF
jgi:Ca-activated chloride channel family protein